MDRLPEGEAEHPLQHRGRRGHRHHRRGHSHLRVAALTAALLALSVGTGAAFDRTPEDRENGSSTRAKEALKRAERLLGGRSVAAGGAGATTVVVRLRRLVGELDARDRRRASAVLARPTDNPDPERFGYTVREHDPPRCSRHFCIHWVDSTRDAPRLRDVRPANGVPDYVDRVSGLAEHSYGFETGTLGWTVPKRDGRRGGNGRTDIYIKDLLNGALGIAIPDDPAFTDSIYSYLLIDDDFSRADYPGGNPNVLRASTIAHEFAHVLQYTYDFLIDPWFGESVAVWVQQQVFPGLDDYLRFVWRWRNLPGEPLTSLRFDKAYGDVVWNLWLAARHGRDVIRTAFERTSSTRQRHFAVAAYDAAIRAAGGAGFSEEFARFAVATAEWGAFPAPDRDRYLDVRRAGDLDPGETLRRKLDHTAYLLLDVDPVQARSLTLHGRVKPGVRSAVALIGRIGSARRGRVVTAFRYMRSGGEREVTMSRPGRFDRITAVIVNADGRWNGVLSDLEGYVYPANDSPLRASITLRH